jgi:cell division protease FtsH
MTDEDPFLGREIHQNRHISEHTMEVIDEEVHKILTAASERAFQLLAEQRDELEKLTKALVEQEELDRKEIEVLIGPSPFQHQQGLSDLESKAAGSVNEPEPAEHDLARKSADAD